ncbi:MAG: hypothetical protein BVN34_05350 [Proteobacteria bacterium ST_bin12]|nr:MAG: hypothetical protein BVN34_05350 [Proteobacteria bacterium ST_bin12]
MQIFNLPYMNWWVSQVIKKVGLFGILGLAITLGCFLFYGLNILTLKQKIADTETANLQAEIEANQVQMNQGQAAAQLQKSAMPKQTSVEEIQRFYAQFPLAESLPNCLGLINKIALKERLILNRGDYKLTQIKQLQTSQGALARYEIVLPVTGKYTQIRQFIAQVLHQLPALALSDMQLKRENAQSPLVEAQLIFVLMLKGDSSNQSGGDVWQ